jgi:hypothetical protein
MHIVKSFINLHKKNESLYSLHNRIPACLTSSWG